MIGFQPYKVLRPASSLLPRQRRPTPQCKRTPQIRLPRQCSVLLPPPFSLTRAELSSPAAAFLLCQPSRQWGARRARSPRRSTGRACGRRRRTRSSATSSSATATAAGARSPPRPVRIAPSSELAAVRLLFLRFFFCFQMYLAFWETKKGGNFSEVLPRFQSTGHLFDLTISRGF